MKFNDGFWLLKTGVKPFYGLQVVRTEKDATGYDLRVATRPIRHRGDTLYGPVLTVRVHSPTQGVIGVKLEHVVSGDPRTHIQLFPDDGPVSDVTFSKLDDQTNVLKSGDLTAEIKENPYSITFKSTTRILTESGLKHQALYHVPSVWTTQSASNSSVTAQDPVSNPNPKALPPIVRYLNSELNISPGELIYGLGEQFGAFAKNGQSIKVWNQDGGTSSDQAYKCVPFYITNRNYGVFINHPGEVEVEVGSEKVSRVGISVADTSLEYFIIYGATPLEILERYTRMTGRPAVLPSWTYGLWLSTSFLTSYSSETVSEFLQGMKERDCPVRVFHIDCFWMKQYEWCSFTFDPDNFPDPKAYLAGIKEKYGVKICLWINPYISQLSPIFKEGVKGGYFIKRTDGTTWQWDLWQPGLAVVDVTNPAAREWYCAKLTALLDVGVDCFKTDFGERIPHASVVFHDGSDPVKMHNTYSVVYNEMVFDLLKQRFGTGEAVVFARAATVGGQRFPVHWGGDCESTWEAMAEATRGALSLTVSGFGYASHDIGGFEGHPPSEIYQRWVAFGLFSSHSRLHGSSSYRVPWNYGEDAAKTMAKFVDAKHRLMPYLYNLSIHANSKGHPLMRAMFLEFPNDRSTHYLDRQYMLGPNLLIAPVFVPIGEEHEYYIPAGTWTSFFHPEETVQGPKWLREHVAIDELPVWVRPGSVLPLGPKGIGRPDYDYTRGLEIRAYGLELDGPAVVVDIPVGKGVAVAGQIRVRKISGSTEVAVEADAGLQVAGVWSG
ncbi:glycoside hydrolase family 31 protein [Hypholoma sublateritium FD-334 SS-4]|uniref:alpha-D-xyloside xylohydrolase n=1 Tax=Hypholoma sublateritium (strain FD-334 SS-4) TaxID=945553 RepID=A0A0D2MTW7_HYPSF|nr:glycoside hydrolase family 31 protein [Hypholoma sublateritium FD-334 SS-4]